MRTDLSYYLVKNFQGFKCFIREQFFWFRKTIETYEYSGIYEADGYEKYAEAIYVSGLYESFFDSINNEEKAALKYLRYHNPNDKPPDSYNLNIESCYEKWSLVFFKNKNNLIKEINIKVLGQVMKRVRLDHNLSSTTLAHIIGVDRSTINKYENGQRIPTLNNILKFCQLFRITIDELISTSLF